MIRLGNSEGRRKLGFKPGTGDRVERFVYLGSKFSSYPWLYTVYSVVTFSTRASRIQPFLSNVNGASPRTSTWGDFYVVPKGGDAYLAMKFLHWYPVLEGYRCSRTSKWGFFGCLNDLQNKSKYGGMVGTCSLLIRMGTW